jgi:hypothetical protein
MNVLDILSEASLVSGAKSYSYGHAVRLKDSPTAMKGGVQKILDAVPGLENDEKLEWIDPKSVNKKTDEVYSVILGRGGDTLFFRREDNSVLSIQGPVKTIEGLLLHYESFNRGDIAEGLLGAALTAKLVKRGGDRIGKIDITDIKNVLKQAVTRGDNTMVVRVNDKNSEIADNVNFYLRLPTNSMAFIKTPANWDRVQDLFSSALEYCNGVDAERYSNYFYRNGKVDDVRITSDGVGGSKERKTDVQAVVYETDPITGKKTKRDLKNVDISLKADSDTIGQMTSGGLQAKPEVWLANANEMFNQLGVSVIMPSKGKNDIISFWNDVYKQAFNQLKTILAGSNANKETAIIEQIADFLEKQGSQQLDKETNTWGVNKNLKLLSFKGGTYTMHSFAILKKQLIDKGINLDVKLVVGKASQKPKIVFFDTGATGLALAEIRYTQGAKKSSNYFTKGPLMSELTKIEKHKHDPSNVAVGQAPTKTAPATAPEPAPATSGTIKPTGTTKAKSLSIEPVKHDANAFPQWKGRQPANPGLAPVGTVSGSTSNIPSTKRTVVPADDEVVAESKKRIK